MLEALGSSAGLVIAFTIINDHYYPTQTRRIISYLMLAFAIIPGIATLIGGTLIAHFHWLSCFYFLLIYGLLLIIPAKLLAETAIKVDQQALNINHIRRNYLAAFNNTLLRNSALFYGLTVLCVYAYAASAPFIGIKYLHIAPETYGLLGLIPYVGTALGALVSGYLSHTHSARSLVKVGAMIELIGAVLLAGAFGFNYVNVLSLIGCGFIFMFGGCLVMSNMASIASSAIEDKANASAVMNFISVSMAVCGTLLLAIIPGSAIFKLPLIFMAALILMAGVWRCVPKQG
jgi:DHA1 family bicyclomycin/chloramphenicol resistance-like MFS transporter